MKAAMEAMKSAGAEDGSRREVRTSRPSTRSAETSGFTATVAAGQTNDFTFAMAK